MDNINRRASNSLAVYEGTNRGFDGLAVQVVNPITNYDFLKSCREADPSHLKPKPLEGMSRSQFIKENFPLRDDADLTVYRWLFLGICVLNRKRLCTLDTSVSRSLRALLMDSLDGFSRGKAQIVYHSISEVNPIDKASILEKLLRIEEQLEERYPKEHVFVEVVGDQPVFKILFELWYDSLVNGTSLCEWRIPLPGGFHIEKQALIPTLKSYMAGACLEELLRFTGLSPTQIREFLSLSNYRKSRRAMHQVTAAQTLRICDVIQTLEPDIAKAIEKYIGKAEALRNELDSLDKLRSEGASEVAKKAADSIAMKEHSVKEAREELLPRGCHLKFSSRLPPEALIIGKLLCNAIDENSKHSLNMKFFAKVLLLDSLVTWTAFNVLTRLGQTMPSEKFWFYIVGVLHGTTKINCMENMLWYAFVKCAMPSHVYDALYNRGHLVAGERDDSDRALQHADELMEGNCIKHSKIMTVPDGKIITRSVGYTRELGETCDQLERELDPSRKRSERNSDVKTQRAAKKARRERRDAEKRTTVNIYHMYEFLSEKSWLGEQHLAMEHLLNPLREPPLVMTAKDNIDHLVNAEHRGRIAAELHCCTKMTEVFGALSDEEIKQHFGKKGLKGKWSRSAFKFKSMADVDPVARKKVRSSRQKGEEAKLMNKRLKKISNYKNNLLQVFMCPNAARIASAKLQLEELKESQLILAKKAFAYRESLTSDEPCSRPKSSFFRSLQQIQIDEKLMAAEDGFVQKGHNAAPKKVFSIHFDVMNTVHHHPIVVNESFRLGKSIYNQCDTDCRLLIGAICDSRRLLRPYLHSQQYSCVRELHFHMDVTEYMPLQKKHEQGRRIRERSTSTPDHLNENGASETGVPTAAVELNFDRIVRTTSERTWAALLEDRPTKGFVARLHCVLSAKAAIDLLSITSDNDDGMSADETEKDCDCYIHGAALTIANDATTLNLRDIKFSRLNGRIVISKKDGLEVVEYQDFVVNADVYDASCCWKVSNEGFQRWPSGECKHGESETRTVHTVLNVSRMSLIDQKVPKIDWRILVVAMDTDTPLITALSDDLIPFSIVHKFGETFVRVQPLRRALEKASMNIQELVLLYAMAGCD